MPHTSPPSTPHPSTPTPPPPSPCPRCLLGLKRKCLYHFIENTLLRKMSRKFEKFKTKKKIFVTISTIFSHFELFPIMLIWPYFGKISHIIFSRRFSLVSLTLTCNQRENMNRNYLVQPYCLPIISGQQSPTPPPPFPHRPRLGRDRG